MNAIRKLPDVNYRKPDPNWIPSIRTGGRHKKSEISRRICDSKRHFPDFQQALSLAKALHQHLYLCHICQTWHLTSQP